MKQFHIQITKIIVETIEAETYEAACEVIRNRDCLMDYGDSFHRAEPQMVLLDEEPI